MSLKCLSSPNFKNASFKCSQLSSLRELELDIDERTLVIFDIDEVLITTEDHFVHPYAEKIFLAQVKNAFDSANTNDEKEEIARKLSLSILLPKRILVEEDAPMIVKQLQEQGVKVIGLTTWPTGPFGSINCLEHWRIEHLRSLGINFTSTFSGVKHCILENLKDAEKYTPLFEEGILFAPGYGKGDVLKEFLNLVGFIPSKVYFIDDLAEHIESVQNALQSINLPCKGFQYLGAQSFFKSIDKEILEYQFKHLLNDEKWLNDREVLQHLNKKTKSPYSSKRSAPKLFHAHKNQPFHLSIGAVLFDQNGHIACHYFKEVLDHKDVYVLMTESMEDGETPLMTLNRGLMEEFGASAEVIAFLGSSCGLITDPFNDPNFIFNKTILYFACQLTDWNTLRRNNNAEDPESHSFIGWFEPENLISLMQQQGVRFQRIDADESEMIKRALPHIQQSLNVDISTRVKEECKAEDYLN